MAESDAMHQTYNEEMKKIQDIASYQLRKICEEHEKSKAELEARRNGLKFREEELTRVQTLNKSEQKNLDNLKKLNEMAILEEDNAYEKILKFGDAQKKEKES